MRLKEQNSSRFWPNKSHPHVQLFITSIKGILFRLPFAGLLFDFILKTIYEHKM